MQSTRDRRGSIALNLALSLGAVLLITGFTGSMQVSMSRVMLERVLIYRMLDLVSSSCFEEVSARLEASMSRIDFPHINERRDLGKELAWPAPVEPELTRKNFADRGVELGAVEVKSSPWLMFQAVAPDGALIALERGYLEMRVVVKVKLGRTQVERLVTCRRFVSAEPPTSGNQARLRIQGANLFRTMKVI